MDEGKGERKMVTNRKVKGKALSMPVGLVLGLGVSLVVTLVGSGVITYLVLGEKMGENVIGYGAMVTVLLSAALGALTAVGRIKRRRLLTCLACGGCYFGALLSMTALFFGGQYQGMGVTALLVLGGAGSVALLSLKGEGQGRGRKKKYRIR